MLLRTRAPAKINLTLHVVRRREDGFHDLESLVAFAGVADILELDPAAPLGLEITGPTASAAGAVGDNLVLKAARALRERIPDLRVGGFRLIKRLPVGAGIGGGSSDAAAGLRLLARLNDLSLDDVRLREAAKATGSDVPVCVEPRLRMMRGTGATLGRALTTHALYAVLANPGVHLDTKSVFSRMAWSRGQRTTLASHPDFDDGFDRSTLLDHLRHARNDMQDAAGILSPDVPVVLEALGRLAGVRLARMSGSGSTCFGVFEDRHAARAAASIVKARNPAWWVKATALM